MPWIYLVTNFVGIFEKLLISPLPECVKTLCAHRHHRAFNPMLLLRHKNTVTHREHSACVMLLYVSRMPGFGEKVADTVWDQGQLHRPVTYSSSYLSLCTFDFGERFQSSGLIHLESGPQCLRRLAAETLLGLNASPTPAATQGTCHHTSASVPSCWHRNTSEIHWEAWRSGENLPFTELGKMWMPETCSGSCQCQGQCFCSEASYTSSRKKQYFMGNWRNLK